MTATPEFSQQGNEEKVVSFWERIYREEELRDREPLEKLLVGPELIAALDGVKLLAP